jgi:hypothetical protein
VLSMMFQALLEMCCNSSFFARSPISSWDKHCILSLHKFVKIAHIIMPVQLAFFSWTRHVEYRMRTERECSVRVFFSVAQPSRRKNTTLKGRWNYDKDQYQGEKKKKS